MWAPRPELGDLQRGRHSAGPRRLDIGERVEHVSRAQHQLLTYLTGLLTDAATAGQVRTDTDPGVLATYCLYGLAASGAVPGDTADKPVELTLAALRPVDG